MSHAAGLLLISYVQELPTDVAKRWLESVNYWAIPLHRRKRTHSQAILCLYKYILRSKSLTFLQRFKVLYKVCLHYWITNLRINLLADHRFNLFHRLYTLWITNHSDVINLVIIYNLTVVVLCCYLCSDIFCGIIRNLKNIFYFPVKYDHSINVHSVTC